MNTRQKQHGALNGSQRLAVALFGTLIITALAAGCSSRGAKTDSSSVVSAGSDARGEWLCEAGKAADDWDCIQSEDIAPKLEERRRAGASAAATSQAPSARREDLTRPQNVIPRAPQPIIDEATRQGSIPQPSAPPAPEPPEQIEAPQANNPAPQSAAKREAALTTAIQKRPEEPLYARLAYRPDQPVRIVDLPDNFYAAQLLAVSTKEQIEDFVVAQDLYNMSAARIERDGQMLYVLLLGVYESKDIALSAVAAMPTPVQSMQPWVRPIDGLQDAMERADRLAATAGR